MSIRLTSYLKLNRFGVYYFRRAIPPAIAQHFPHREIYRSLRTFSRRDAIIRAQAFGIVVDQLFRKLRAMTNDKKKVEPIEVDMVFELDLDGLGSIKMDMEPHEVDAGKALINHTIDRLSPLLGKIKPQSTVGTSKPFSAAVDAYLVEFERAGRRPESVLDYRGDFNQFIQILGDLPVSELGHEKLNFLKQTLIALPPNINKLPVFKGKTIDEILAMGLPGQAPKTVQKKWTRLESFLDWAVGQGWAEKNYAKGKKPKAASANREKFTDDELARLFESEHYAAALYEEPFQYWIPLIAAFTGARLEEISQLHLADLKHDQESGVWYFDITEDADEQEGAATAKNLKNTASVRACPVHSKLIAAGLIDYANELRQKGYDRLFPELSVSAYGKTGDRAGKFFTAYRRQCGVGSASGPSTKVFHCFRHTMNARLQRAGVAQEVREALIGHSPQSTNVRVYGDRLAHARLRDELEKLTYSFTVTPYQSNPTHEDARKRARQRSVT